MTRIDVFVRRYLFLEENLSKKDFRLIHMDRYALGKIVDVFIEKWDLKTLLDILKIYKDNKIKIWDFGLLNPITVYRKARIELSWWSDIKKNRNKNRE